MRKPRTTKGMFMTMLSMAKEDWDAMDKKFYRLAGGIGGFVAMGLFWFYVLRHVMPF
ncbi:MAG TPA: hypothetical protein VJI12_01135 [archaeon]|nr:hypothetical protein [archaeon]